MDSGESWGEAVSGWGEVGLGEAASARRGWGGVG